LADSKCQFYIDYEHLAKLKTCTLYWELITPLCLGMKLLK